MNGRKFACNFGLLRNSTIFRFAKNWDSDSARRKPPKVQANLSRDLMVQLPFQKIEPHITHENRWSKEILGRYRGRGIEL